MTRNRAIVALLIAGAIARILVLRFPGTGDLLTQKVWSFGAAYDLSGVYGVGGHPPDRRFIKWQGAEQPVDYPPLQLEQVSAVGRLYRAIDPMYRDSTLLTMLIKLPGLLAEIAFVVVLITWGRKVLGRDAAWAAIAFWITPGIWYTSDAAGYVDAQGAIFAAFSVVAAAANRPMAAGILIAAGALTKPQCVYVLPVIAAIIWARADRRWRDIALASAGGGITTAIVLAPFAVRGALPNVINGVSRLLKHDMLSAQGANLAWIWTWILRVKYAVAEMGWHAALALKIRILGMGRVMELGYPNPRWIGMPLVVAALAWAAWRAAKRPTVAAGAALAGWCVYAYVIFGTAVHENHFYPAIPLFAIAAAEVKSMRPVFWASSLLFALNIYLFYGLGEGWPPVIDRTWTFIDLTVLLSVVNVALFVWCTREVVRLTASVRTEGPTASEGQT